MRWLALTFTLAVCLCGCKRTEPNGGPDGSVATPCSTDTECKGDHCVAGTCLPASCGDHPCHSGQGCVNGECRSEDCLSVSCSANESCGRGKCYPTSCASACASGDLCVQGLCVFAGCAEKPCATGAACADGHCWGLSCGATTCASGAVCGQDNHCVAQPCLGISCPDQTACAAGRCVPLTCGGTACPTGQACVNGACADPTCTGLTCAAGLRCAGATCVTCPAKEASCGDGVDDDCDGLTDCADPDCEGQDCADGKTCKGGVCADEPCGNGRPDPGEDCDDNNRQDGDGCSSKCKVECGFTCDGQPSVCTADDFFDLSDTLQPILGANGLRAIAVADDGIYAAGEKGKLVHLDRLCNATDLSSKLSAFWQDATIVSMSYDAKAKLLYLGGATFGRFALYHPPSWNGTDAKHPGADAAFDLSDKHALTTEVWSVDAIVADATAGAAYLAINDNATGLQSCGPSHLTRYRPDTDACEVGLNSCGNPCVNPPDSCAVQSLALDDGARVLWAVGRGMAKTAYTGIHQLDLASGTFHKAMSASLSNNIPTALALDGPGAALYLCGQFGATAGGDFVSWAPATATTVNLTDKLTPLFGAPAGDLNDMWALAVDPVDHVVYVGGNLSKLARYRTPQDATGPDTAVLVGLSATTWGQETVRALAYDPAGFVWIAGDTGRLARMRAKP